MVNRRRATFILLTLWLVSLVSGKPSPQQSVAIEPEEKQTTGTRQLHNKRSSEANGKGIAIPQDNLGYLPPSMNLGYLPPSMSLGYLPPTMNLGYLPTSMNISNQPIQISVEFQRAPAALNFGSMDCIKDCRFRSEGDNCVLNALCCQEKYSGDQLLTCLT